MRHALGALLLEQNRHDATTPLPGAPAFPVVIAMLYAWGKVKLGLIWWSCATSGRTPPQARYHTVVCVFRVGRTAVYMGRLSLIWQRRTSTVFKKKKKKKHFVFLTGRPPRRHAEAEVVYKQDLGQYAHLFSQNSLQTTSWFEVCLLSIRPRQVPCHEPTVLCHP